MTNKQTHSATAEIILPWPAGSDLLQGSTALWRLAHALHSRPALLPAVCLPQQTARLVCRSTTQLQQTANPAAVALLLTACPVQKLPLLLARTASSTVLAAARQRLRRCCHSAAAAGERRGRTSTWQCQICSSSSTSSNSSGNTHANNNNMSAATHMQQVTHSSVAAVGPQLAFMHSFRPLPALRHLSPPPPPPHPHTQQPLASSPTGWTAVLLG